MSNLFYYQFLVTQEQIIEDIKRTSAKEVTIMCSREWECNEVNTEFGLRLQELGVKLRPIYGSFRSEYYDQRHNNALMSADDAYFWGTFWNTYIERATRSEPNRYKWQTELKHTFISLNNRSHLHRCMFIDKLAKYDLIDKGVVTWIKHLNENIDYPYQYYDNSQRLLDDNFVNHLDSMSLPKEYHESLFDIITESNTDKMFMTEKTFLPIALRKPFIVLGAKGFHKKLVDLGFKLFDEIIDYSFDEVDDLEKRTELFVQNVQRIAECDPMTVYESLKYKLQHNYIRMLEIANDPSYIPEGVKLFYETIKDDENDRNNANFYKDLLTPHTQSHKFICIWGSIIDEEIIDPNINQLIADVSPEGPYDLFDSVIDIANVHQCPVVLLTSTYNYNKHLYNKELYYNTMIVDWPAYWLARGIQGMCEHNAYESNCGHGLDIYNLYDNHSIDHLYITMNNLAKRHRCIMLDMLAKHELIELGAIAWRDVVRHYDDNRNEIVSESTLSGYVWKYWTPKKMTLDFPMDMTSRVDQTHLPPHYAHSFMQIVTESNPELFFITEKTSVPLVFGKLFLVAGPKNFHANLIDMGFELYTELFDYSFDQEDDIELRYEGIALNVARYKDKTADELKILMDSVRDKRMRNRNHTIKMSREMPPSFAYYIDMINAENNMATISYLNKSKDTFNNKDFK